MAKIKPLDKRQYPFRDEHGAMHYIDSIRELIDKINEIIEELERR